MIYFDMSFPKFLLPFLLISPYITEAKSCSPDAAQTAESLHHELKSTAESCAPNATKMAAIFATINKFFNLRKVTTHTVGRTLCTDLAENIKKFGKPNYGKDQVLSDTETLLSVFTTKQVFNVIATLKNSRITINHKQITSSQTGSIQIVTVPHKIITCESTSDAEFVFTVDPQTQEHKLLDYKINQVSILNTLSLSTESLKEKVTTAREFLLKLAKSCNDTIDILPQAKQSADRLKSWLLSLNVCQ